MADEEAGEAATVETTETTPQGAQEAPVSSEETEQTSSPEVEAEARKHGWKPEGDWKGEKPPKFYSAAEWLERPIVALQRQLKDKDKELERRLSGIERVNAATIEKLQAAHEKEVNDLKAQRREAIKEADVETVEKLDKAIDKLTDEAPKAVEVKKPEAKDDPILAREQAFADANPWVLEEPELSRFLAHWTMTNGNLHPELSFEENMAKGVEATKRKFPDKFKTAADRDAAVDAGGSFSGTSRSNPLSRLPNEARAKAKEDMAKYPKVYPTAESWIAVYEGKR